MRSTTLLMFPLLLAAGCAQLPDDNTPTPPGSPGPDGVTFCRIQTEIFDATCVQCHAGAGGAAGLDLSSGASYAQLVGVTASEAPLPRVTAGDSAQSYLYHKLAGTQTSVGGSGGQMPLAGSLTQAQVDLVKQWIDEGATLACDGATPTPAEETPTPEPPQGDTLCAVQQAVFTPYCVSCHSGSSPSQGLDLSDGKAYDALVGVASTEGADMNRVAPGNPDQSYLYHKLAGTHLEAGGSGGRMPLGQAPLSEALIDKVRSWITNGASEACDTASRPR